MGWGKKITFQANSWNIKLFYVPILHLPQAAVTSSCCWRGDRECRFLRTMRYVTYTHFVWDLFCYAKTTYKKIDSNKIHIRLANPDVAVYLVCPTQSYLINNHQMWVHINSRVKPYELSWHPKFLDLPQCL